MMTMEEHQSASTEALTEESRAAMARVLAGLSDREFAEFFYATVRERNASGLEEWKGHLVLGEAEKVGPGPWTVDYIGVPRKNEDSSASVICQEGRCARCKATVRSWARSVACPICDKTVYCP